MFDSSDDCGEGMGSMQVCRDECSTSSMAASNQEGTTLILSICLIIMLKEPRLKWCMQ